MNQGTPADTRRTRGAARIDVADIAPWVIAEVLAWPKAVRDRIVADGIGVRVHHVQLARATQRSQPAHRLRR